MRFVRWLNQRGWLALPDLGGQSISPSPQPTPRTLQPGEPADFKFPGPRLQPFVERYRNRQLYIVVSDRLGRTKAKVLPGDIVDLLASGQLQAAVAKHDPYASARGGDSS